MSGQTRVHAPRTQAKSSPTTLWSICGGCSRFNVVESHARARVLWHPNVVGSRPQLLYPFLGRVPRQLFQNPMVYNSSTANTSVLRHHSRCASCSDFRSRHHQEKFSLGTNHLTRWQLPFKQPDGTLHNARPSTRCGGSSAVKSGSIHEHVGGGEGRGSSGRRRRRGREEEARFGRRGRRSRGRGSARDGEGESGHVGV